MEFLRAQQTDFQKVKQVIDPVQNENPSFFAELADSKAQSTQYTPTNKSYRISQNELIEDQSIVMNEDVDILYSQVLKATGNSKLANKLICQYCLSQDKTWAHKLLNNKLNVFYKTERMFIVYPLPLNTENSEFGAVIKGDQVVFTAVKEKSSILSKLINVTHKDYYDLLTIPLSNINNPAARPINFSTALNSPLHESNAIFTKDGKYMYFCRNNSVNGLRLTNSNNISTMQLFRAEFNANQWTNITALPFNSFAYSVEHPALSPDEKILYFSSDMPGSLGSFDLYKVDIIEDSYGLPINLGPQINTPKREQFPFISQDNKLYFSSDGHLGFGALDVFVSELEGNSYSKFKNLGLPINSSNDDFAFYINSYSKEGYFSSDRLGGKGKDDIYGFKELEEKLVEERDHASNKSTALLSKQIEEDTSSTQNIVLKLLNEKEINFEKGRLIIKTEPIFFDFKLWYLRKESKNILNRVVDLLNKYPKLQIEVGSYCDNRGDSNFNLKLSQKRAKAVKNFLISQGISNERVLAKGYGTATSIRKGDTSPQCSEEEHEVNRRIEFVIRNFGG